MLPEIQSLLQGSKRGNMQFAGEIPSDMDVGGAPPNVSDPAQAEWDAAFRSISRLADKLHQQRREVVANKVAKQAVQLQHLALEQRKKIAENAAGSTPADISPVGAAGNLHAQGVPANY